jgi:hypothetical protein
LSDFQSSPAPARSTIRAKPAVVNGDPRSLVKTKGDAAADGVGAAALKVA